MNERSGSLAERTARMRAELVGARDELMSLLADAGPVAFSTPGLVGEWSGQELLAHVGYWAGHAIEVMRAAERGTTELLVPGQPSVDEINATVARVARQSDPQSVQTREASAFEFLVECLTALDPALLDLQLPAGQTVAEAIQEDGAAHYQEHAADLRAVVGHVS